MKKTVCMIGTGVVPIPSKFGGGTEIFIHEISKFITKKMSCIIIDRKWPNRKDEETHEGIKFYGLKVPKFKNIFLLRITEFLLGLKAVLKIKKIKPDIIHLHTVFTALPFTVFRFLVPETTKLVYTCHNPAWTVPDLELDKFNLLIEKIEHFVIKRCDFVTADSKTSRDCIIRKSGVNPKKIFAIYNFVDREKFSKRHRKSWKKRMGIKDPIVLYVSKLTPAKGIEYFVRSIPLVKEKIKNVKFVAVGPVSFEQEMENPWVKLVEQLGVSGDVIFTGALSNEELPEVYQSAEVFCLPTQKETFCIVLAEAMASGLPIVSSDLPSIKEVTDGASVLVERKNIQELAEAIGRLLISKKLRKKLIRKALLRSKEFDKRKVLKDYLRFYEKIQ